ncbi:MAG TPA: hypothetical protein VF905_09190, partial [Nitrospirota bacterium]
DKVPTTTDRVSLGDAIKETERQRRLGDQECAGSSAAVMGSVSFNDRYADAGLTSVSGPRTPLSKIDEVEKNILADGREKEVKYDGMRVVVPTILDKEQFEALNSEAKNEYLGHASSIIQLVMHKNFEMEKEAPETFNRLMEFLKAVLNSAIFQSVWLKNYITKATEYHELRTLPYYTARSLGMFDIMFDRMGPDMKKFLSLYELKILRPDLKHLGQRGESGPPTPSVDLPPVLSKTEYDALSPADQRTYYDNIQKVVNVASFSWFGSAPYQVSEAVMNFLKNVLYSDVFSDGWENFIKKATPDHRFSKTYYAAQALGFTDGFLEKLIGQFVKFEPEAADMDVSSSRVPPIKAQDVKDAKVVTPAKVSAKKPVAKKAVATTAARKPAAKKAVAAKVPAKSSATKASAKK